MTAMRKVMIESAKCRPGRVLDLVVSTRSAGLGGKSSCALDDEKGVAGEDTADVVSVHDIAARLGRVSETVHEDESKAVAPRWPVGRVDLVKGALGSEVRTYVRRADVVAVEQETDVWNENIALRVASLG